MRAPAASTHAAPRSLRSVRFPIGPERRWQLALSAAFVLLLLTEALWWLAHRQAGTPKPLLLAVMIPILLADGWLARALLRLGRPVAQSLVWTGQAWQRQVGDGPSARFTPGDLQAVIDLGDWMLLRHRTADGRDTWLAVSARPSPIRWHALRRALLDSTRPQATEPLDDRSAA